MKINPGYENFQSKRFYQSYLVGHLVSDFIIAVMKNYTYLFITNKIGINIVKERLKTILI